MDHTASATSVLLRINTPQRYAATFDNER